MTCRKLEELSQSRLQHSKKVFLCKILELEKKRGKKRNYCELKNKICIKPFHVIIMHNNMNNIEKMEQFCGSFLKDCDEADIYYIAASDELFI